MGSNYEKENEEQLINYYAENTVFVAVGKNLNESESVLTWAVQKFSGKKRICILHVHQPHLLTFFDGKLSISKFKQRAVKALHESHMQKLHKLISQYVLFVSQMGVRADRMWIETESIEDGIVKMIAQHGIKWLVMGAAADKHYTKEMAVLKSQKAIFVYEQAPVSCHIWFTCKGKLICTRERIVNDPVVYTSEATESQNSNLDTKESDNTTRLGSAGAEFSSNPQPVDLNTVTKEAEHLTEEAPDRHSLYSDVSTEESESESLESDVLTEAEEAEHVRLNTLVADTLSSEPHVVAKEPGPVRIDRMAGENGSPPRLTFRERGSILRACSVDFSSDFEKRMVLYSPKNCSTSHDCIDIEKEDYQSEGNSQLSEFRSSIRSVSSEGKMAGKDKLQAPRETHGRLEQAISDAENLKKLAFQESVKRWKAEEDAVDAKRKADAAESKYIEQIKQRKSTEQALVKQNLECESIKEEYEKYMKELPIIQDQCFGLKTQIRESETAAKELEEKIISAVELLISFRNKRDQLQTERDNAVIERNNLKKLEQRRTSALSGLQFSTFSLVEVGEATCSFDPSKRIGDGRYGSVYRAILRHVHVAIQMLPDDGYLSQQMFEHGVEILSRIRHQNIATIIGICPEARSIIYEYLEKGSLEDQLTCRGKTPPLQWQTRVHIATELCSTLIFLHSNNPPIYHGNLKPSKVLLDANFTSKIGDLGIFFLTPQNQHSNSVYIDPVFLKTGVLTRDTDVYSFGMIVLRLLTDRPDTEILKDVKCALQKDKFESVLDFSAGDWPVNQARTLARMALRCCERNLTKRPDLGSDIWSVLEPLRKSCDAQASSCLQKKENIRPPSHFVCPIFKEVMKDPCTAADGYTYEEDAIRGWLESGHTTSPMTNLKLPTCNLIPNHTLQYAIQEWLQRCS
ncbi:hypothetical protein SOVF_017080 [Spinacia oleracea]|nr:hypothetical protein SOVF_017080 [Spinacia oleracea]